MERPSILAHLQIVDVFLNPLLLWVGTHLAVPSSDKDDCKVGALAAGVKILLHVGTGQCEGEVGKAAGSGVRAIWEMKERKPFNSSPAMLGSSHDLS